MQKIARTLTTATTLLATAATSFAHEGHGLAGPHWHATDVWGFVAFAALVALAVWLSRSGK